MRLPWLVLSLFWALVGCSGATKAVRLDTGRGAPVVPMYLVRMERPGRSRLMRRL